MTFLITFVIVLLFTIGNIWYHKHEIKEHLSQDTTKPISVSYSAVSEDEAEKAFFDKETRIMLYPKTVDGITSFYLDEQLSAMPINGFYCDGFFVISIVDHGVSFKELT